MKPMIRKCRIQEKLKEFEYFLTIKKGLYKTTVQMYSRIIHKVLKDLSSTIPTNSQLENYVMNLYKNKYSHSHLRNNCIGIELFSECFSTPIKFGRPKKPKPIIKSTLSEADIILLIHSCKNIREKAILSLLAYSGIRCDELCNLKLSGIDFGRNIIKVIKGKNMKDRVVCISPECITVLMEYLNKFPRNLDSYLFTAKRSGNQFNGWSLRKIIKNIGKRILPNKQIHPHLFRHSLATIMLNRGANLLTIKEQLGHEHIETTMIYVRSSFSRIEAEYRLCVPKFL